MPELYSRIPLPFRRAYLSKMYPALKESDFTLQKLSLQQSEVFRRYYGWGCEPMSTSAIQEALGIRSHNQVAVQLDRAESKLGCDKDERLKLAKDYKKAYYRKCRPKCPFCRASKARFRGLKGSDINWQCGKCHRSFQTSKTEQTDSNETRVEISFLMNDSGEAKDLKVAVNGTKGLANGWLEMVAGDKDWSIKLGKSSVGLDAAENSHQPLSE